MKSKIHGRYQETPVKVSKFLIILLLLAATAASGLTSLHFFRATDYDLSSLLVIATYLSMVFGIYVLTTRKKKTLSQ